MNTFATDFASCPFGRNRSPRKSHLPLTLQAEAPSLTRWGFFVEIIFPENQRVRKKLKFFFREGVVYINSMCTFVEP